MPIDPSIALNVKAPQFESPTNALAQILQVQHLKQQTDAGAQQAEEYQRNREAENKLAGLIGLGKTGQDVVTGLAQAGFGTRALAYGKQQAELAKQQADTGKTVADTGKINHETATHQFEMAGQLASAWAKNPAVTQQDIRNGLAAAAHSKIISPEIYQAKIAELDAVPGDSGSLNKWALGTLQQVMKAKDSMGFITPDANTIANNATSRANNAATVAASRDNAAATRDVAAATRDAARIQRDQGTEMKLADDYRNQSKGFKEVSDAYLQISATLDKATMSPAATLAAATKFMKLLDPGSVVRESELGMALAATGAIDRLTNYTNTLKYGKVLTSQQVDDFRNITKQIYGAAQTQQQKIDANYRQQATTYGLRPEVIIQDLGQNAPAAKNGAASGAGAPPSKNSRGWTLMRDAQGNQAYVSPDGKQHEEVR